MTSTRSSGRADQLSPHGRGAASAAALDARDYPACISFSTPGNLNSDDASGRCSTPHDLSKMPARITWLRARKPLESTVAVNVKDAREPLEMCLRTTAPALRGDT